MGEGAHGVRWEGGHAVACEVARGAGCEEEHVDFSSQRLQGERLSANA